METPDTPNAIELSMRMAVMATTAQAVHVDVNMLAVRQKLDVKAVLTYSRPSPGEGAVGTETRASDRAGGSGGMA